MSRFSAWLDLTISNMHLTNRDLAEKLNVSEGAVSRWKKGKVKPNFANITAMAEIFQVDPLRLAVTAGLSDDGSIAPLPIPNATARQRAVREQILEIKHVTDAERQELIEYYEMRQRQRHGDEA